MDNSLKPYDKYKETDQLWLTKIPANWDMIKIKHLFNERIEKGFPNEVLLVASQSMGVVPKSVYGNRTVMAMKDLHLLKLVKEGDFVISLRSFQGGIEYAYYQGIISPAYTVMKPKGVVTSGYFRHLAKSKTFIELLQMCVTGIREGQNIDYNKLKHSRLPVPSLDEQDQIVRYLDWKLAKVNKFIKAKKKQIELLKEQKQVIINQAVTKGIDSNVSLKESGIKCIGLIPKHWKLYQLGKIAKIVLSGLDKKSYEGQQSILLCNYVDVYKNEYITDVLSFMKATASDAELATLKLRKDDVIITKDSESWDDIGVPAYVTQEIENLHCGYHLAILRTNKSLVLGEYLYDSFRSQYVQIQHKVKAKGVTRFALGYQPIHDTVLLIPPIEEQEAIVEKIRIDCSIQDTFIIKLKKEIELLLEYKTSLLSDVVTGKVDVRNLYIEDAYGEVEIAEFEDSEDSEDELLDTED